MRHIVFIEVYDVCHRVSFVAAITGFDVRGVEHVLNLLSVTHVSLKPLRQYNQVTTYPDFSAIRRCEKAIVRSTEITVGCHQERSRPDLVPRSLFQGITPKIMQQAQ